MCNQVSETQVVGSVEMVDNYIFENSAADTAEMAEKLESMSLKYLGFVEKLYSYDLSCLKRLISPTMTCNIQSWKLFYKALTFVATGLNCIIY